MVCDAPKNAPSCAALGRARQCPVPFYGDAKKRGQARFQRRSRQRFSPPACGLGGSTYAHFVPESSAHSRMIAFKVARFVDSGQYQAAGSATPVRGSQ